MVVVEDVVLAERPAHVQTHPAVFPGVAAGVRVVGQVTLQDLSQSLLRAHLRSSSRTGISFQSSVIQTFILRARSTQYVYSSLICLCWC